MSRANLFSNGYLCISPLCTSAYGDNGTLLHAIAHFITLVLLLLLCLQPYFATLYPNSGAPLSVEAAITLLYVLQLCALTALPVV